MQIVYVIDRANLIGGLARYGKTSDYPGFSSLLILLLIVHLFSIFNTYVLVYMLRLYYTSSETLQNRAVLLVAVQLADDVVTSLAQRSLLRHWFWGNISPATGTFSLTRCIHMHRCLLARIGQFEIFCVGPFGD